MYKFVLWVWQSFEVFKYIKHSGQYHALVFKKKINVSGIYTCTLGLLPNYSIVILTGEKPVEKGTREEVLVQWEKMSKSKYNGVDPQV